jgi:hypothetical protein
MGTSRASTRQISSVLAYAAYSARANPWRQKAEKKQVKPNSQSIRGSNDTEKIGRRSPSERFVLLPERITAPRL